MITQSRKQRPGAIRYCFALLMIWLVFSALFVAELARADGFYFEVGVSVLDKLKALPPTTLMVLEERTRKNGDLYYVPVPTQLPNFYKYDITNVLNPQGNLELGYEKDFHCFAFECTANVHLSHDSFLATGSDHGQNAAGASLRIWFGGN
jgi:hypothetical protein